MDFPRNIGQPTHINSWMNLGGGLTARQTSGLAGAGNFTWGTANTAVYLPFYLPTRYLVQRVFWNNGSAAGGNSDIGIFTGGGVNIWSAGSTVNSGNSVPQYVTPSSPILLTPGWFFLAYAINDVTANRVFGTAMSTSGGRLCGVYQQASALPLPSTATFAQYAGTGYPLVGITNTTSGF